MDLRIKGACSHNCPDTCGWVVTVRDGTPVRIEGDPDHPYTRGWLCTRVNHYLEFVLHPERLLHPMRRVGARGESRFAPISWDEALDEIASRWRALIAEYGPEAILPYSYSGTLGAVQSIVANTRLWTRMGASQLERTICSAAGAEGVRLTVGGSYGSDPEDVVNSRLVLLWGTNPASTHPHFIPFLDEARRRGARVLLIDPHRTLTANRADWHLAPRPGSDAALALAMMHVAFAEGRADLPWLAAHSVGWEALHERVAAMTPEWAAPLTGLPAEEIRALGREYASAKPGMIRISMGLQRHTNGANTVRAIACLPAVTGQYGRSGGGLLYSKHGGPVVEGITWEMLLERGTVRLNLPGHPHVPRASGRFPTPSGKVELYSRQLADAGEDPLPGWVPDEESAEARPRHACRYPLQMVSPANHYFLNSSFANVPFLMRQAKEPTLEISAADAAARDLQDGDWAIVENDRGWCRFRVRITATVRPGVVATTTMWWNRYSPDGGNANFTTSDALSDRGNCATFHGNLVEVRKIAPPVQ